MSSISIATPPPPPTTTTAAAAQSPPSTPPTSTSITQALSYLGLGYGIAITLGFLVLLSTILLISYLCFRRLRQNHPHPTPPPPTQPTTTTTPDGGIILPRIIFVAENSSSSSSSSPSSPSNPQHRSSSSVGLAQAVINSYPKSQFVKSNYGAGGGGGSVTCSICLCDYREGEMQRIMPDCNHSFHLLCLDAWLRLNGSCPVCRNSPLPTPLSTPLAEVVPLAQWGDNRRGRRS